MKPALSVIFFTVSSGAGLGLLCWLALATLGQSPYVPNLWWTTLALAMSLVTAGLLSSTLHLANRKNAIHALRRIGSSWLSREGAFALALYPAVALLAWAVWREHPVLAMIGAALVLLLASAVLIATAMIYAVLKTIPQWHNWQTEIAYPLFGLMSGSLLMVALWPLYLARRPAVYAAAALLALGLVVKLSYYLRFKADSARAPSLNQAPKLGIDPATRQVNARVRLLDVGHSGATFLTNEFGFDIARRHAIVLRVIALGLGFLLPGVLLVMLNRPGLASVLCVGGLLVERWLFFAEARHVVRLYHGQAV